MEPSNTQLLWMYETMVGSASSRRPWPRSISKASCRRIFRGPGLRHRRRPGAGRDAPGGRAGASGRGRVRPPAAGRHRGRHPPPASLRYRQGRAAAGDDRRDLRQGHRAGPRQGRPHAPVRSRAQFAAAASSAPACPRPAARRWPQRSWARTGWRSPSSARARPTRARSTSH